jgi:hypothetical protein
MPFQSQIQGRWRVTAVQRQAAFDQRFVIAGSANADGIYPGVVGTSVVVAGNGQQPWALTIQHNAGSGWANSELRETPRVTTGSQITLDIQSEDLPGQPNPDFNDLVVRVDKVDAIEVPFRPYAVRPDTLQMMPDGVFEALLGSYYMSVRVQNVWTQPLPADSLIGISVLGRSVLAAGGIQVIDTWTTGEQEIVGQQLSGSRIVLGGLAPWEMRTVYFKVNCVAARPRKHAIEFELVQPAMPDPNHPNRRAKQKIFATRTSFNSATREFIAECDQGRLFLKLREVTAEFTTLRDAVRCARAHRARHGDSLTDRATQTLKDLLAGNQVDLCELKRLLDCICGGGGPYNGDGRNGWACGEILMFPTKFDYRVEFNPPYTGQLSPLPFDDPWWKLLLIILAIILTIAAGASATSDLAYRSDDVVIGKLVDSQLLPEVDGNFVVDAALCELNGNRELPSTIPPIQVLDARSGEDFTVPVDTLDGVITLTGETMTNTEIADLITAWMANPLDPVAIQGVRVFKSGARTGTTHSMMTCVEAAQRTDDGVTRNFKNQVRFVPLNAPDPAAGQPTAKHGDSGSLWIHSSTRKIVALEHMVSLDDSGSVAHGSRIHDVMVKMNIRFR